MKKILIANWKMNKNFSQASDFAQKIKIKKFSKVLPMIAPAYVFLPRLAEILAKSNCQLVAQDVSAWVTGSYTGEVSAQMLKSVACRFALIGHSERRHYLAESDELINQKVKRCLEQKITPVICLGETWEQKKSGQTSAVVIQQLKKALNKIDNVCEKNLVIAYEPVWAIGSGQFVDPIDLETVYKIIKRGVAMLCSSDYFEKRVKFIYGGSVNDENLQMFLKLDYLDGFLVGSYALKIENFLRLVDLMQVD